MMGLLGCFTPSTLSTSTEISVRTLVYCHAVGYMGDDHATEATFGVLSHPMMQEFRRTGALFAKHFETKNAQQSDSLYDSWKQLVHGSYRYSSIDYIIRNSGEPIDFNHLEASTVSTESSVLKDDDVQGKRL